MSIIIFAHPEAPVKARDISQRTMHPFTEADLMHFIPLAKLRGFPENPKLRLEIDDAFYVVLPLSKK